MMRDAVLIVLAAVPCAQAHLADVAPTLAYLLGLPVAHDLPGDVVTAAFTPDHLTANHVHRVPSWTIP